MPTVTPFLWFDDQAEEAMNFYDSIFEDAKPGIVSRAGGRVMSASFELDGRPYIAFNGGPLFKFTEAISLYVNCENQAEVDDLWSKLSAGGVESRCGWLKDKFGVWWQIIPSDLPRLLGDPDPGKAKRVMDAMLKMTRIDIAGLQSAHRG